MTKARQRHGPTDGRITRGIEPQALVERTIEFVASALPLWRDDPKRPAVEAEEKLNSQLCKFLDAQAREHFPMAGFHHEEPQGKRRRVDMSAAPTLAAIEAGLYHDSIYEPFLVLEGKRIPAPAAVRKQEYVTGFKACTGGIQRFKLSLHGAKHDTAVMIGYLQSGHAISWWHTLNQWIAQLAASGADTTCRWSAADQLQSLLDGGDEKVSRCESRHARSALDTVRLVHLWVQMPTPPN